MKYSILPFAVLFVALGACSISQKSAGVSGSLKQEAKDFSLSFVALYFEEDCDQLYGAMSDSIYVMDGDGVLAKSELQAKLCRSFKKAIRNKERTYQDYQHTYEVELLTPAELVGKFESPLPEYFDATPSDFFFLGSKMKNGLSRDDHFIWSELFVFMVRKEGNTWKVKGVSG